ncbi:MAG: MotA/TolQ/ExbB proton channel family protein [Cytophagales bacterium]|nr:MotA/TolQ/ExbB proton channel family protein [Armatimonadota bacterium]
MWDLFRNAGWAAYPLGFCSVIAVAIVLERFYTLGHLRRLEAEAFRGLLRRFDETGQIDAANTGDGVAADAPSVRVLEAIAPVRHASVEARKEAADIALSQQRLRLRRFLPGLATIGSTAPFIGLFGTVLGVMTAFRGMSTTGLSGETMASGISEALSATALGLLVAIPAVFAYNFFTGAVSGFLLEIQNHTVRLGALMEPQAQPGREAK